MCMPCKSIYRFHLFYPVMFAMMRCWSWRLVLIGYKYGLDNISSAYFFTASCARKLNKIHADNGYRNRIKLRDGLKCLVNFAAEVDGRPNFIGLIRGKMCKHSSLATMYIKFGLLYLSTQATGKKETANMTSAGQPATVGPKFGGYGYVKHCGRGRRQCGQPGMPVSVVSEWKQ